MMTNDEIKRFFYVSLISADNEEFTEEQKQAIIQRYNSGDDLNQNWEYVLEPIKDSVLYSKYLYILKYE